MAPELRETGISVVGDLPWGAHFCFFYETKQDLLDILIPYFKIGLANREFCLWVISNSELLTVEEATSELRNALPDLDRYMAERSIEIVGHEDWFLSGKTFDPHTVANRFRKKLNDALARGHAGMRVNGSPSWLHDTGPQELRKFEAELDKLFSNERTIAACTYPLAKIGAGEIFDVARTHQFAIARRQGEWEVLEAPELIQAKQEIKKLNEELEQRVIERTNELRVTNEQLRKEITERKQAEDVLRRSEDHFRLVLDTTPALIHTGRPDGYLDYFNQRWLKYVGRSLEELQGWGWTASIHPDDVEGIVNEWRASLASGEPFQFEARVQRADGEYRWMLHRKIPLRDEHGNILKWHGSSIDIEDRKRAEAALRKSEEQFRQMAENIREVFWLATGDLTRILYISPAYEVVWGQSRESLYLDPRSFFAAIHAEDRSRVVSVIERDREQGFEVEYRVVRPDGSIRWIRDRGFPIRDESGRFYRVAGIAEDITEHKHAEALLHAKEQEFRAIVENAPDQIIRYDREFRRTYVNPAVLKAYGLPAESLIGKPIGSVIQDAALDVKVGDLARLRQVIADVFDTGKLYEYEMSWPAPAGRRYYSVRFFPELDLNGSVVNVLGISRDMTERRIAEEELKKEKEILEKIVDNIPVMIGFVGQDGRVKLVNPEWERTIGWTLKELQEQNVDIFAEAYPDLSYRQEVLNFVAASTGEWVDLKIRVRDGRTIDVVCAVVHLSDGTRVAIAQDITERKQAEEKLRHSEIQLAQAQRLAHVGSWDWDMRTNKVTWSDELYRIFGLEPGAIMVAGDATLFIHPDDRDLVWSTIKNAVAKKERYSFYYRAVRPDGTERIVHSRGAVLTDDQGEPIRVFGASQDVTELKHVEEKLTATTEQLRALSASVQSAREEESKRIAREIHDELGGALTSWRWDLEEIRDEMSLPLDASQVAMLGNRIEGMIKLTETTLDTVRRIASELRPAALELGLVQGLEWQVLQFESRTGISVQLECDVEEVDLESGQATAVFRILQEALTNIQRHAQATHVTITCREESGQFVLTIKDNGRGITTSEESATRSLGLLGMRERANLVGGEINIESAAGEGTKITVRVPISGSERSGSAGP